MFIQDIFLLFQWLSGDIGCYKSSAQDCVIGYCLPRSNTSNTILIYCNTSNTIHLHGYTGATRATPYLYIATRTTPYISVATQVLHYYSLRLYAIGQKYFPTHHPPPFYNINTITMVKLSHPPFKVYSLSDHNQIIIILLYIKNIFQTINFLI